MPEFEAIEEARLEAGLQELTSAARLLNVAWGTSESRRRLAAITAWAGEASRLATLKALPSSSPTSAGGCGRRSRGIEDEPPHLPGARLLHTGRLCAARRGPGPTVRPGQRGAAGAPLPQGSGGRGAPNPFMQKRGQPVSAGGRKLVLLFTPGDTTGWPTRSRPSRRSGRTLGHEARCCLTWKIHHCPSRDRFHDNTHCSVPGTIRQAGRGHVRPRAGKFGWRSHPAQGSRPSVWPGRDVCPVSG